MRITWDRRLDGSRSDDWQDWRNKAQPLAEIARDVILDSILEDAGLGGVGVVLAIIPILALCVMYVGDNYITPWTSDANDGLSNFGRRRWLDAEDAAYL